MLGYIAAQRGPLPWVFAAGALLLCCALPAFAQIEITEIMFDTSADENVWEWAEIRNTTASPVNLDGWVFDDDDDNSFFGSNISSGTGNTIVPAGGAAVLYNGTALGFDPSRFTDAWGSGITLVGVSNFPAMANTGVRDAIGLWSSLANYQADDLMTMTSPRRSFTNAVTSINFDTANGYPSTSNGRSIAWSGTGSPATPGNWGSSVSGTLGAVTSVETIINGGQINSLADAGTPGILAGGGTAPIALLVTEIMYNPRSTFSGGNEAPFEWIEVYNNTGSTIDFGATPYVLDDDDNPLLTAANINSGSVPNAGIAVLFNSNTLSVADMETAWEENAGLDINFIPVSDWSALGNSGDLVAIWDSLADYQADKALGAGSTTLAADAVLFDSFENDWPADDGNGSIYLADLGADPNAGLSWILTGGGNDFFGAINPDPIIAEVVDHPGGDVGSPGFVPSGAALVGDYNGDGKVDAADYVVWRKNPGAFGGAQGYTDWRANFGAMAGSGSGSGAGAVPEPGSIVLLLIGLVALRQARRPA
ncbi:MAG: lamin tail domain-containing protein [Pirellulales bacterium]